METVSVGTEVTYHGSYTEYDGETFKVIGTHPPLVNVPDQYPDGVAYMLVGPERLSNVRRGSFTVND